MVGPVLPEVFQQRRQNRAAVFAPAVQFPSQVAVHAFVEQVREPDDPHVGDVRIAEMRQHKGFLAHRRVAAGRGIIGRSHFY
jgi:hypothetical protein